MPPSGRFLARLFLVPGLIVALAVVMLLGFSWLASGARSPARLLDNLRDSNPDVKWRAAHDLAQVLLRDDQLASNPKFALDLAEQMRHALSENGQTEGKLAEMARKQLVDDEDREHREFRRKLEAQRSSIQYLSACLGNLATPVGASLLNELAVQDNGASPETLTLRHRQALWALANLGRNCQRFDKLPEERQRLVLSELEAEAADVGRERGQWARVAWEYLHCPSPRSLAALGVPATLTQAAADRDPFARELVALNLNFWDGDAKESADLEALLVKLSHDDGHGDVSPVRPRDEREPSSEAITKIPGLEIRYNATVALARRGSKQLRLDVLKDMLTEELQRDNFRIRRKNGQEVPDEATARTALTTALQAVVELQRKRPETDLAELHPAIARLAESSSQALKVEAERTLLILGKK